MLKRALISLLTAVGVVLVGSCGSAYSNASQGNSGPVLDSFQHRDWGTVDVVCRKGVMYIISDAYYGMNVQRIDNHKECEGK